MDPRDDRGETKQALDEPSQKIICLSIEKGKRKKMATNEDMHQRYPGLQQYQHISEALSMSGPSASMLFEQQNQRPIPVGNTSTTSLIMAPHANNFRQQISEGLYEYNTNPNIVNVGGRGPLFQASVPTVSDVTVEFQDQLYQKLLYWAATIQESWASTGCSVILDGWVDQFTDRTLVNVTVDCPQGMVFQQSLDLSNAVPNVDVLEMAIERVINKIGSRNVVQVVSYEASPWLDEVGERIKTRHQSIFWSISPTYCLTLMLERVASMNWIRETIEQAKRITRLVHSDPSILDLFKKGDIRGDMAYYLVKHSMIKAATPFLTLEEMLLKRKDIETFFTSKEWTDSRLGSTLKGRNVANLVVSDNAFWMRVTLIVKGGMPIVNVLCLMNDGNNDEEKPKMGILYETMDQMKETIREEIGKRKARDFWVIIDDVWDKILHSPLHATGCYLNPKLFYTEDFVGDSEVMSGLMATILKIGGDQQTQGLITQQLDLYQDAIGDFRRGVEERKRFSPVSWWKQFGNHCPELQEFAIKILGLSCNGASPYQLRREVIGNLISPSEIYLSHPWLMEYYLVSYSPYPKKLQKSDSKLIIEAEFHPLDDWIVGEY